MLKKAIVSFIVILLVVGVIPARGLWGGEVSTHADAQLTEVPPGYIGIYSEEDLDRVRENLGGSYILMGDIDLTEDTADGGKYWNDGAGWNPIGNAMTPFTGTFDGNGHKIIGLKMSIRSEHFIYAGLFGMAINAKIKDLGIENNQILAENTSLSSGSSDVYAGGIVGYGSNILITNSYHTGTVTANSVFNGYAGGLVGLVRSSNVSNSYNTGEVYGKTSIGGLVGEAHRTKISDVYNTGSFVDEISSWSGGIIGYLRTDSSIVNAYNTADIQYNAVGGGIAGAVQSSSISSSYNQGELHSMKGFSRGGGIVGSASSSTVISNSYNNGNISSLASYSKGGGIVGYLSGSSSVIGSYNTANINMDGSVGGIIGEMYHSVISGSYNTGTMAGGFTGGLSGASSSGTILDSYNIGSIQARLDGGGIVGHGSSSSIKNTYNVGSISRTHQYATLGGIAGEFGGTVENSYYYSVTNMHGVGYGGSEGTYRKNKEEMKDPSTFIGFDFSNKWKIGEGTSFQFPTNGVVPSNETEKQIELRMASYPIKGTYVQGEAFDVTGLELAVFTNHGNTMVVPITEEMVTGYDPNKVGTQTIKVMYGELSTNFNVNVIAKHTVTFKDYDGSILKTEEVVDGEVATAPEPPVRRGYTFTGWSVSFDQVKSNLVITAQYEINVYTVTYMDGNSVLYSERYEGEHTLYRPSPPTKAGYTFLDWYQDHLFQYKYSFNHPLTSDVRIYAKFSKNPVAPTGLTVKSAGFNKLKLAWNKVSGAEEYEIQRATSATGDFNYIYQVGADKNTLIVDNLEPGKTYYFKIRAVNKVDGQHIEGSFTKVVSGKPVLATVTSAKATSAGFDKVKVSWAKQGEANGYEIYRATSSTGSYSKIGTVTSGSTLSYTNGSLHTGKTYYYKIRAYRNVNGKKVYSSFSSVVSGKPQLSSVSSVKATSAGYTKNKVSWGKVSGAHGYVIYRSLSKTGTYSKIKTVTSVSTLTYTNSGLETGKTYYYKIKAYRVVDGKNVYGSLSSIVSSKPALANPASLSLKKVSSTSIKASWGKVSEASGYELFRSSSKSGKYSKIATISGSSKVSYTNKSLTKGKTYYYKVRTYRVVKGKKIYSSYSSVKSLKL